MLQIRNVLCPIGFDDLDQTELGLATGVCRSFGARLILLHNLGNAPLGASMSWMWQKEHRDGAATENGAAERLRGLLATLPPDVEAEAHLCDGVAAPAILQMEETTGADLVVMATHGASTEDHASIAEQIVERSRCPVLVWRAGDPSPVIPEQPGKAPLILLVATDFSSSSTRAVEYAFDLARTLPLQVHLVHVVEPAYTTLAEPAAFAMHAEDSRVGQAAYALLRLEALVPLDLDGEGRVSLHAEVGDPAAKIAEVAERIGASYLIMGSHARGFLRRIFTRDTSLAMLHRSPCPVWFVPEGQAA